VPSCSLNESEKLCRATSNAEAIYVFPYIERKDMEEESLRNFYSNRMLLSSNSSKTTTAQEILEGRSIEESR
jgi:hypothetical protein